MTAVFFKDLSEAVCQENVTPPNIRYNGRLPGPFPTSELLAETVGLVGLTLARLCGQPPERIEVDARLCAFWADTSCQPVGWTPPELWNPLSAAFKGADGWIRLHANASHHKTALLCALGCIDTVEAVTAAIAVQNVAVLEEKIIGQKGAAARMITWQDWQTHPQGQAIAQTDLVEWTTKAATAPRHLRQLDLKSARPLTGLKVLDLTRVLAGPVATRTLAGLGAQVLRIDPASWDDAGVLQDTTLGKYCSELDLKDPADRARFEDLLRQADLLVHGYRPGALEGLGYGPAMRERINPGLIELSLSAYGVHGPWAQRRGFDSLVQFSTGIADLCRNAGGKPGKLPVQALDHATGYIMAACCLEALRLAQSGRVVTARTSLARMAWLLCQTKPQTFDEVPISPRCEADFLPEIEASGWGEVQRLRPPLSVPFAELRWNMPAGPLRRHPAQWP